MEKVLIDLEEYEIEKEFSKKYVSPFFRYFYLKRYQILRFINIPSKQARRKCMSELNIVWNDLKEEIADEQL